MIGDLTYFEAVVNLVAIAFLIMKLKSAYASSFDPLNSLHPKSSGFDNLAGTVVGGAVLS